MKKASDNLEAVRANKITAIENFLYKSESDMNILLETAKTLRQESFDQLKAVRTIKQKQIENYFATRLTDVSALAANPVVIQALTKFSKVKGKIQGSEWQAIQKTYAPWFTKYIEEYDFIDMFIVSNKGRVLYTVEQASDLGQNLRTGKLKNSPAGKAFRTPIVNRNSVLHNWPISKPSSILPNAAPDQRARFLARLRQGAG